MAENTHKVLIGARGWLHRGWQDSFYPDDLPQGWRLAYYANEFSMLVIREQEWAQIEDIATLREECPADFHFVVELPVHVNEQTLSVYIDRIRQLGKQCSGVIIHAEQANSGAGLPETLPCYIEGQTNSLINVQTGTSLKQLRVLMETALQKPDSAPVLLIVDGEPPDIELLRNAKILFELLNSPC